jgi:putative phosphotransacetylase
MKTVIVETSARHMHLTQEAVDTLFGKGYQLTKKKDLSQPGQYACAEKVEVVGPKGSLMMSILGPTRPESQVEVSFTDARALGITPPVRESGDIAGTPGCTLRVGENTVELTEGVIVAKRHIHLTPEAAAEFGVADKEIVKVRVSGTGRTTIFDDVVIRVKDSFAPAMHIDTDECNAAAAFGTVQGEIIK